MKGIMTNNKSNIGIGLESLWRTKTKKPQQPQGKDILEIQAEQTQHNNMLLYLSTISALQT